MSPKKCERNRSASVRLSDDVRAACYGKSTYKWSMFKSKSKGMNLYTFRLGRSGVVSEKLSGVIVDCSCNTTSLVSIFVFAVPWRNSYILVPLRNSCPLMSMVDDELTIVLIRAKVVRSVNVVKGRRPVIPKLDMISPYAHTPQVIFCILGKQFLHCICCCLTQPRLVCKSHQQNYNSTPRRPQTDQDREERMNW